MDKLKVGDVVTIDCGYPDSQTYTVIGLDENHVSVKSDSGAVSFHVYHVVKKVDEMNNMTELPKNGWYVELPENKDDIDLDKLNKALNKEYEFYYPQGSRRYIYYYIDSQGNRLFTDFYDLIKHFKNLTHLFKKKEEDMEIIEINGKKYRQISIPLQYENGDLILVGRESIATFIGYDDDDSKLVIKYNGEDEYTSVKQGNEIAIEEIKVRTLYYAICKNKYNAIYTSGFYESKDIVIDEINALYGNILEIRTFEEQL